MQFSFKQPRIPSNLSQDSSRLLETPTVFSNTHTPIRKFSASVFIFACLAKMTLARLSSRANDKKTPETSERFGRFDRRCYVFHSRDVTAVDFFSSQHEREVTKLKRVKQCMRWKYYRAFLFSTQAHDDAAQRSRKDISIFLSFHYNEE